MLPLPLDIDNKNYMMTLGLEKLASEAEKASIREAPALNDSEVTIVTNTIEAHDSFEDLQREGIFISAYEKQLLKAVKINQRANGSIDWPIVSKMMGKIDRKLCPKNYNSLLNMYPSIKTIMSQKTSANLLQTIQIPNDTKRKENRTEIKKIPVTEVEPNVTEGSGEEGWDSIPLAIQVEEFENLVGEIPMAIQIGGFENPVVANVSDVATQVLNVENHRKFSKEEDALLLYAVSKNEVNGRIDWSNVMKTFTSQIITSKTEMQCVRRYHNTLKKTFEIQTSSIPFDNFEKLGVESNKKRKADDEQDWEPSDEEIWGPRHVQQTKKRKVVQHITSITTTFVGEVSQADVQ